jgi:hypothetical protein
MALSAKKIEKVRKPGRYGDGHGLYLQVTSETNRSWLFRYQRGGRERMMGLGPLHTLTLKEAREKARLARQKLLEAVDPLDARHAGKTERALAAAKASMSYVNGCAAQFAELALMQVPIRLAKASIALDLPSSRLEDSTGSRPVTARSWKSCWCHSREHQQVPRRLAAGVDWCEWVPPPLGSWIIRHLRNWQSWSSCNRNAGHPKLTLRK